mmetsp:Transcript_1901/g.3456  ORF Transcript_1901/g.3456 Transcript_1901/m.3456 type:complete len:98 (-) Transcript_1901:218-511(-)
MSSTSSTPPMVSGQSQATASPVQTAIARQAEGYAEVVLKAAPQHSARNIALVPNGQKVQVFDQQHGEYVLTQWQGIRGFAKVSNLEGIQGFADLASG